MEKAVFSALHHRPQDDANECLVSRSSTEETGGNPENLLGHLPVSGGILPTSVTPLRILGHGRAAEARLVRITTGRGQTLTCVEKVFCPGLLTRVIYRAAFQAPFAYQDNADAIRASFYRRRVAASIIEAMLPHTTIARPLYVRWDRQSQAMVLASEFIAGRGIDPQAADPWMMRRRWAKWMRSKRPITPAPPAELDELLTRMGELENLLLESGLTGSGWQVCQRAIVSTANLLRLDDRYVVVDLESGIPSVLVPAYVSAGLSLRSLPLFDDLDAEKLRRWVSQNGAQLARRLSPEQQDRLHDDVECLIRHTESWKQSEPALGRRPQRLLRKDFRQRLRTRILESWRRREIIDAATDASLRSSRRLFSRFGFLMGLVPGPAGRFFQRLWGNTNDRRQAARWLRDPTFRRNQLLRWSDSKIEHWRNDGRLADDAPRAGDGPKGPAGRGVARFVAHWLLSKTTPAWMHRWIADPIGRRNRLTRVFLLCLSRRFQGEFGRLIIRSRLHAWRGEQRLSGEATTTLLRELESPALDEYLRGFSLHMGLKLLMPLVWSLKVGGVAASVASGNPLYLLFTLMLLPFLRTCVTLWRMFRGELPASGYRDALLIGMLPVVGSLAYPVQMYSRFSPLSLFMMRDFAARFGRWLPIYGGRDSRTEMAAIKSVNVIAECLELWLTVLCSRRLVNDTAIVPHPAVAGGRRPRLEIERWERQAREQCVLMEQELGLVAPPQEPPTLRRAA